MFRSGKAVRRRFSSPTIYVDSRSIANSGKQVTKNASNVDQIILPRRIGPRSRNSKNQRTLVILDEAKGRRGERLKKKSRTQLTTRFDAGGEKSRAINICILPRTLILYTLSLRGASPCFLTPLHHHHFILRFTFAELKHVH